MVISTRAIKLPFVEFVHDTQTSFEKVLILYNFSLSLVIFPGQVDFWTSFTNSLIYIMHGHDQQIIFVAFYHAKYI